MMALVEAIKLRSDVTNAVFSIYLEFGQHVNFDPAISTRHVNQCKMSISE